MMKSRIFFGFILALLMMFSTLNISGENLYLAEMDFNGNKYAVVNNKLTWDDAKKFCESLGGHLVTLTTADEDAAVYNLLTSTDHYTALLGGTDLTATGEWKWVTDEKWEYENWDEGEPNSSYEHYLSYHINCGSGWNDFDEAEEIFICEWENASSTPSDNSDHTGSNGYEVKVTIGSTKVIIGEKSYDMGVAPYIQTSSNSVLVPLRFVVLAINEGEFREAEADKVIEWNADTKTATIPAGEKVIKFTAGSNTMLVDGTPVDMGNGVKAEILNGRVFIPFRVLGDALDVDVEWDSNTRTAIYKVYDPSSQTSSEYSAKTEEISNEQLYAPILNEFYENIMTGWKNYNYDDSVSYMFPLYYSDPGNIDNIGYCFKDLNSDGISELLIGIIDDGGSEYGEVYENIIYDLYSYKNGEILHLDSSGERYTLRLCDDNKTLLYYGAGGADYVKYSHCRINDNADGLTLMECVFTDPDYSDGGYWYYADRDYYDYESDTYIDDAITPVTEEKAYSIMDSWPKHLSYNINLFRNYNPS